VAGLEVFIPTGHGVRRRDGIGLQIDTEPGCDGKVPRCWRAGSPARDIHVSWAAGPHGEIGLVVPSAIFIGRADKRSQGKEPRPLELGLQVGSLGGMEDHVAQEVVPARAVAPSTAHESMIPKTVEHAVAELALKVIGREAHSQPPLKHSNEERRLGVELGCFAGESVEKDPGILSAHQAEVSAAGVAGGT